MLGLDGRICPRSGVQKASVYVYKWRFPDSTFVRRRSLNDADIPQDEYLHRNLHAPVPVPWMRGSFSHSASDNYWTTFLDIFSILQMPFPHDRRRSRLSYHWRRTIFPPTLRRSSYAYSASSNLPLGCASPLQRRRWKSKVDNHAASKYRLWPLTKNAC